EPPSRTDRIISPAMTEAPAPPPGPIALVGSGEFLPVMESIDAALLGGRPPRAVFLPTASAPEGRERVDYWLRLGAEHYQRLGVEPVPLAVLDRRDAGDPANAAAIAGAGLVYLSGGNPGYLADTLRATAVLEAILAAWQAGAALAGCSAGACALTALADDTATGITRPGLAVVPELVVLPHFDRIERWRPGITDRRAAGLIAGRTLVGIDEETALVSGDGTWRVEGRQKVWIVEPDGRRTPHSAGAVLALPAPTPGCNSTASRK
ncbi:MAG: Type 1 glutamine amidotransferase-like domain-containing protein, partial [Actinobacteria bacterium]|nr:Type 1 glutamine amidotransferase-like domain-containing protein [Actinomycetota bacterium]